MERKRNHYYLFSKAAFQIEITPSTIGIGEFVHACTLTLVLAQSSVLGGITVVVLVLAVEEKQV